MQVLPKQLRRCGWLLFGLMWIPFAGIFVGMLGLPDGDYALSELPPLALGSIILTGGLMILSMVALLGAPVIGGLMNRRVLASGRTAGARILSMTDTGTTINNNPLVRFELEVQPDDRSPFRAETEKLISRLEVPRFQPGAAVTVRYDPETLAVALDDD